MKSNKAIRKLDRRCAVEKLNGSIMFVDMQKSSQGVSRWMFGADRGVVFYTMSYCTLVQLTWRSRP